jgi:hypothetical protein
MKKPIKKRSSYTLQALTAIATFSVCEVVFNNILEFSVVAIVCLPVIALKIYKYLE